MKYFRFENKEDALKFAAIVQKFIDTYGKPTSRQYAALKQQYIQRLERNKQKSERPKL